ncbi:PQQ-binding-like beta-propeller repeat protein [Pseudobowmanella zhangzhouensis]|uniref:outer membrane protein assembly factor BamB family protein n=1 Tax=Pseudobowmanella zhangzhouensis TaxID=1537679 RepID=UPI0036162593
MCHISTKSRTVFAAGALLFSWLFISDVQAESDWPMSGADINNTRHQKNETTLDPANVANLQVLWSTTLNSDVSATPAVEGKFVYVPDWAGYLTKMDAQTGAIIWQRSFTEYTGLPGNLARATPAVYKELVIIGDQGGRSSFIPGVFGNANIVAVNKHTGDLVWSTQVDAHPAAIITQSATVYQDTVYVGVASLEEAFAAFVPGYPCCSFRGSMLALDVNTGAIKWRTYTAPASPATQYGEVHRVSIKTVNRFTSRQVTITPRRRHFWIALPLLAMMKRRNAPVCQQTIISIRSWH